MFGDEDIKIFGGASGDTRIKDQLSDKPDKAVVSAAKIMV